MDEHRDIYKKSEDESDSSSKLLPAYELTPDQVRTRTRQQVVVFTTIMIGILAGVALYFYLQEENQKNSKLEEALSMPLPTMRRPARPEPPAESLTAQDLDLASLRPPPDLSPQKMADAMTQLREANAHLMARRFDEAEAGARRALEIWPQMNAALRMLGLIHGQRGQVDQAIAVLEKAVKADPFNAQTHNNLGTAYMQKRQFAKAEESLLTALKIEPGFNLAHMNLGLLYLVMSRYDQAIDNFEEAARTMPDDLNLLNNLGVCFLRAGRPEDAREQFQKLVGVAPDFAAGYFNLAISYAMEKNTGAAMEWVRKGTEHCDPTTARSYLSDSDFDTLRAQPEFQQFVQSLYPDWATAPGI